MKLKKQSLIVTLILATILGTGTSFASTENTTKNSKLNENTISQIITIEEKEAKDYFKNLETIIEVDGKKYSKEAIEKVKEDESNKKEVSKEVKSEELLNSKNEEKARENFNQTLNYEEDGFKGILNLERIEFETISQGYYEQIEYLDLDFKGYNQNELAQIEKEITNDGKQWVLINVEWYVEDSKEVDGTFVPTLYEGIKHYQRVGTYQNPNKYKAVAYYQGEVNSLNPEYEYEISYKLIPEEKIEETPKQEEKKSIAVPCIIIGAIGLLVIIFVLYNTKKKKE